MGYSNASAVHNNLGLQYRSTASVVLKPRPKNITDTFEDVQRAKEPKRDWISIHQDQDLELCSTSIQRLGKRHIVARNQYINTHHCFSFKYLLGTTRGDTNNFTVVRFKHIYNVQLLLLLFIYFLIDDSASIYIFNYFLS